MKDQITVPRVLLLVIGLFALIGVLSGIAALSTTRVLDLTPHEGGCCVESASASLSGEGPESASLMLRDKDHLSAIPAVKSPLPEVTRPRFGACHMAGGICHCEDATSCK